MTCLRLAPVLVAAFLAVNVSLAGMAAGPNAKAGQLYQQGVEANLQGKPQAAIQLFEQAADADPAYTDTFFNLGVLHYQLGNYAKAQSAFNRVLELNASDTDAWFNLALTQEKLAKTADAITTLQRIPPTAEKYGAAQGKIAQLQQQMAKATAQKQQLPATAAQATSGLKMEVVGKEFAGPTGIAVGGDGAVFVANYSKNVIDRIATDGKRSEISGAGNLNGPVGLVYHPITQDLYVANYLGNTITKIAPDGKAATLMSNLKKPYYLNLDVARNTLYVSEQETNTVSRIKL